MEFLEAHDSDRRVATRKLWLPAYQLALDEAAADKKRLKLRLKKRKDRRRELKLYYKYGFH